MIKSKSGAQQTLRSITKVLYGFQKSIYPRLPGTFPLDSRTMNDVIIQHRLVCQVSPTKFTRHLKYVHFNIDKGKRNVWDTGVEDYGNICTFHPSARV